MLFNTAVLEFVTENMGADMANVVNNYLKTKPIRPQVSFSSRGQRNNKVFKHTVPELPNGT